VTSSSRPRSDGPADAADASPDDADPCFPFLDAAPVLVAGPDDWTAGVADDLAGAHGFAVERFSDATAATVEAVDPDCVVLHDPARLPLARSVPVVLTADLDDDAVSRVLEHADYVPAAADTPDRDLLAARVASALDRRQRDTERSLRAAAMAQAGVGITIADMRRPEEPLVYANQSFVDVTGYPIEEVVGRNCRFLQGEDTDEATVAEVRRAIEAGEPVSVDLLNYRRDGTPFWNHLDLSPVVDDDGEVTHYFGYQKDITERKRLERDLQRENERLDEFAGVVSHDLRNPLGVASGAVESVAASVDHEDLDRARAALHRMDRLVDDVLTLAREGEAVSDPEPVSLAGVVTDAWRTVDGDDATVTVEPDVDGCLADPERLRTLFENLFRNALEHGARDATVTVRALPDGFAVGDDGPGIPADRRDEVFERGYTTDADGTGFGLAIVQEIAEAHGWTASVGESPADGAEFRFTGVDRR
jgi:PAS domain S-box-containing protein